MIAPEKPISDLKEEFKCFTNDNSSTYKISVNVNQPEPKTREIYDAFSDFPAGHTFLTMEQHNSDGTTIIRNIGFYPKNYTKPGHAIDQSTFGDDSNTPFDASLTFTVTGSEFKTVMTTLINQQSSSYDLNDFNCTNSSINALNAINIKLPDTKSMDLLFSGNDPADLGEDIRNLNMDDYGALNPGRPITRNVSNFNEQEPPARQGTCN